MIFRRKFSACKDGKRYVETITYNCEDLSVSPVIYLARLDQSKIDKRMTQRTLGVIDFNEFDVFQNNSNIGKYICKNQKDQTAKYFHFKKFEFVKS